MTPTILDHLPEGLLDCPATDLHLRISGLTLIHLPGEHLKPLFVSVLQHGNETSGWEAIRRLLRGRYQKEPLPRSLVIFIGNVEAARDQVRHLDQQPDLNRCWPGSALETTPWHSALSAITEHMKRLDPFASIDMHNNTGKNPHYSAVNTLNPQSLQLACAFSKTVVYFTRPVGVQSQAFSDFCPAVTLECGLDNDPVGADHAMTYIEHVLRLPDLPTLIPPASQLDLYQMFATLTVAPDATYLFASGDDQCHSGEHLIFPNRLDQHNFTEWSPGFPIAKMGAPHPRPLIATHHAGHDITDECFDQDKALIRTKRMLTPAMLTADPFAISTDCLCYLMERMNLHQMAQGLDELAGHRLQPALPDQ